MELIADDEAFRAFFINAHIAVIKYHSEFHCKDCERMLPVYKKLEPEYPHIKFGMMCADSSETAQKLTAAGKLPFMAVYKNSLLVQSGTVASETAMITMLDNLPNVKTEF